MVGISPIFTTWCLLLYGVAFSASVIDRWPGNTWTNSNVSGSLSSWTRSDGPLLWSIGGTEVWYVERWLETRHLELVYSLYRCWRERQCWSYYIFSINTGQMDIMEWLEGVLGGVKGIWVPNQLDSPPSRGACGWIVDAEAGAIVSPLPKRADDDDGKCASGSQTL